MSDFDKKLENANPEQAKQMLIDSLTPQCKEVGKGFFNCVESHLLSLTNKESEDYTGIEKKMVSEYVPSCMSKFNLEDCLAKYDN